MRSLWARVREALDRMRIARYRYAQTSRQLSDERAEQHVELLKDGSHDYMGRGLP
jgi:hypothetical protein